MMPFRYFDVKQGTDRWWEMRKGVPTCSEFSRILTPGGELSKSCRKYIAQLVGESMSLLTPENVEHFTSRAIRHGQDTEDEARRKYCFDNHCETINGGFCMTMDGRFGGSPDFLVGMTCEPEFGRDEVRGVYGIARVEKAGELKCRQAEAHMEYVLDGKLQGLDRVQCHGHLFVTGADVCDFYAFHPGCPDFQFRFERDEFTDKLASALESFWDQLQAALKQMRGEVGV